MNFKLKKKEKIPRCQGKTEIAENWLKKNWLRQWLAEGRTQFQTQYGPQENGVELYHPQEN